MLINLLRGSPHSGGRQRFRPALVLSAMLMGALMALTFVPQTAFARGNNAQTLKGNTLAEQGINLLKNRNVAYATGGEVTQAARDVPGPLFDDLTTMMCHHGLGEPLVQQDARTFSDFFTANPELAGAPIQLGANGQLATGNGQKNLATGNGLKNLATGNGQKDLATGNGLKNLATGNGQKDLATGNGLKNLATGNGQKDLATGNGQKNLATGNGQSDLNANGDLNAVMTNNLGIQSTFGECKDAFASNCPASSASAPTTAAPVASAPAVQPATPQLTTTAAAQTTAFSPSQALASPTVASTVTQPATQQVVAATTGTTAAAATYAQQVVQSAPSAVPNGYQLVPSRLGAVNQVNAAPTLDATSTVAAPGTQAQAPASTHPHPHLDALYGIPCALPMVADAAFSPGNKGIFRKALQQDNFVIDQGKITPADNVADADLTDNAQNLNSNTRATKNRRNITNAANNGSKKKAAANNNGNCN
ncbi:MAG: hypothetical protein ACREN8_07395 [Candidatus Dormibacteraceae bacterium]